LNILSSIEVPLDAPERVDAAGAEAVNVVCEAALGTYVGLRPKVRSNAAWMIGRMTSQQARETLLLLVNDPSDDVAIRAIRAVGRRPTAELEERVALTFSRADANPLVVAEAVRALVGTPNGQAALAKYRELSGAGIPAHRRSPVVERALRMPNG
jgi:hypothetical protein